MGWVLMEIKYRSCVVYCVFDRLWSLYVDALVVVVVQLLYGVVVLCCSDVCFPYVK